MFLKRIHLQEDMEGDANVNAVYFLPSSSYFFKLIFLCTLNFFYEVTLACRKKIYVFVKLAVPSSNKKESERVGYII